MLPFLSLFFYSSKRETIHIIDTGMAYSVSPHNIIEEETDPNIKLESAGRYQDPVVTGGREAHLEHSILGQGSLIRSLACGEQFISLTWKMELENYSSLPYRVKIPVEMEVYEKGFHQS